jgi:hypothetical protein
LAAIAIDFYSEFVSLMAQINAEKICANLRHLRETKISSRTTMRSFLASRAYRPLLPSVLYSSFFLEKKGPKIQASLKANAEAPEKCGAACTIFCAFTIWATACRYKLFKIVQPLYLKQKITVPLHFSFRW